MKCVDHDEDAASAGRAPEQNSEWRRLHGYLVHPAADAFPMLSDEEIRELSDDIKRHGFREPISYYLLPDGDKVLVDGRNRLVAGIRAELGKPEQFPATRQAEAFADGTFDRPFNPVAFVISKNARRRHLSKQDLAEAIVRAQRAALTKPDHVDPVSRRGGRGKVNVEKAAAVAIAKEQGISEVTVKRAIAAVDGKARSKRPVKAKREKAMPSCAAEPAQDEPRQGNGTDGPAVAGDLVMARRLYFRACDASPELDTIKERSDFETLMRRIEGKRRQGLSVLAEKRTKKCH